MSKGASTDKDSQEKRILFREKCQGFEISFQSEVEWKQDINHEKLTQNS